VIHVAIVLKQYLDLILDRSKRIEMRLTRNNLPPFEQIEPGERIYFKQSSGPFRATAVVEHVEFLDGLNPARIAELKHHYNDEVCGDDEIWRRKANSSFGTLIWLTDVEPVHFGPALRPQRGLAWLVLPDHEDVYPQCTLAPETLERLSVPITPGNIRHSNVCVRKITSQFPDDAFGGKTRDHAGVPITVELPDGPHFETDIVAHNGILRVRRHWSGWFEQNEVEAGDRLAFIPRGDRRYIVQLIRCEHEPEICITTEQAEPIPSRNRQPRTTLPA
jgi:ASC-1-like (ASCH) protein